MNFKKLLLLALTAGLFFTSCSDDDDAIINLPLGDYENGVLILNQGNFGGGNSSISYLSDDFGVFQNNAFAVVNPTVTLGDTGQDIGFYQDKAFVVLNLSNSIQVINRYTLEHITTFSTGLNNPRYIAFANGKGYVTNWGDGGNEEDDYIAVLNLTNYTISTTIPVTEGPERIIEKNGNLYVAHQGGFGYGETVSVISSASNTVTAAIPVGDVPNSLFIENNTLYVLAGGKPSWTNDETIGTLTKINLTNNTVISTFDFEDAEHPSNLVEESGQLYYTIDSAVYKASLTATSLPSTPLFSTTAQGVYGVYSFAVENNKIYVGDAVDYNSNGKVYVYSLTGDLLQQETVGVIPAGFYFND
ncbi:YncE family protein [Flavobacterium lacus]|uniref:YVTN family beta-propeller protein n=1 Tax=Flavobacterium lacus TaxID=1353778 RepID=A0A328WLT6_9FLAO|nr:DUF5074 domain-containing protein [Flavobacterium lacus]RAR47143.1 hypothetical protein B0I10_11153 [Flavobacterium lacus]